MSVTFSDSLVKRYQEYMQSRYGLVVEREQAQRDLRRLADLHALFSSPNSGGGFTAPARTLGEGRAQETPPEGGA